MSAEDSKPPCQGHDHADCLRLKDLLTDYFEGLLDDDTAAELKAHLGACPPCDAFLAQYEKAGDCCREHLMHQVPDDLEQRLLSFLESQRDG